jgi:hypothetical protein
MKVEMSCYKCKNKKMVDMPDFFIPYHYCPICGYPMEFMLQEDKDILMYERFKKNIEEVDHE